MFYFHNNNNNIVYYSRYLVVIIITQSHYTKCLIEFSTEIANKSLTICARNFTTEFSTKYRGMQL